ncbi:hypothetical protein PsorP6_006043 [Peronosclerospora sorghi]|uniref:Uncharacterized protein n=1 Tax=Peronosclerospora sorghi TaxID=230839 RepID=A0ACC0W7Y4_9STRA|nr:hypothetical protein PsorP6_006043 [Peronosclerospora sorghi]
MGFPEKLSDAMLDGNEFSDFGNVTPDTDLMGLPPRKSCVMLSGKSMLSKDVMRFQLTSSVVIVSGTAKFLNDVIIFDVNVLC